MTTTTADNAILEKTKELCQCILDHPDFQAVRRQIDTFMADDHAKEQYQALVEQSEFLNHKQQQGVRLSPEEIADFQTKREQVINNSVTKGFLDAQEEMHRVQQSVNKYVSKTFELGRLPQEEDLNGGGGGCGHGCGCSH